MAPSLSPIPAAAPIAAHSAASPLAESSPQVGAAAGVDDPDLFAHVVGRKPIELMCPACFAELNADERAHWSAAGGYLWRSELYCTDRCEGCGMSLGTLHNWGRRLVCSDCGEEGRDL